MIDVNLSFLFFGFKMLTDLRCHLMIVFFLSKNIIPNKLSGSIGIILCKEILKYFPHHL